MQRIETSLPFEVGRPTRDGAYLVGDDFTEQHFAFWFSHEQEAFCHADTGNCEEDTSYGYKRYVNDVLAFTAGARETNSPNAMLVLGLGTRKEVDQFAKSHPSCKLAFLEASQNFQAKRRERFPNSSIVEPKLIGTIDLADQTQDMLCALSVLYYLANVSKQGAGREI
jgi:hypothetical protein